MVAAVFQWTDHAVSEVKRLHADGMSFSQIAAAIGCPSRNAVIGKASRLGLERGRPAPAASPKPEKVPKKSRALPPDRPSAKAERRERFQAIADQALDKFDRVVAISSKPVRFLDRSAFQCAMPQPGWDATPVAEKRVCGAPVVSGTSWCRHCLAIVGVPASLTRYRTQNALRGIAA